MTTTPNSSDTAGGGPALLPVVRRALLFAAGIACVACAIRGRKDLALAAMVVCALLTPTSHGTSPRQPPAMLALGMWLAFGVGTAIIASQEAPRSAIPLTVVYALCAASSVGRNYVNRVRQTDVPPGLPPMLAASAVLSPLLLGSSSRVEGTSLIALWSCALLIPAALMFAPIRMPAPTWRLTVHRPSLSVLIAFILAWGVWLRSPWIALGSTPLVFVALWQVAEVVHTRNRPATRLASGLASITVIAIAIVSGSPRPIYSGPLSRRDNLSPAEDDRRAMELGFRGPLLTDNLPDKWKLFHNRLVIGGRCKVVPEPLSDGGWAMRMSTTRSSFALDRVLEQGYSDCELEWTWRSELLPVGGDVRIPKKDDQAMQVVVYFDNAPLKEGAMLPGKCIAYIWDTTAPLGATADCEVPFLQYTYKALVLQSGPPSDASWPTERRNLSEDYKRLYGEAPPPLRAVRIQANSQHTGTESEGVIRNLRLVRGVPQP